LFSQEKSTGRDFLTHFYIAIMGRTIAALFLMQLELSGRDLCRARLRHALELVGGPQSVEKRARLEGLQQQKYSESEVL
jgi:hypothetical protein